jgi:arginyl-tRNA synthetase
MFKSLFNMAKKKKVAEKPMEMAQEPMEVIVEQPIIEKVEVKEEKQQDGVRTIVSHNG